MAGVSTKEIKNRIRSMESTKQITKAMEMVAASKLRKAQNQVLASRPYFQILSDTIDDIVSSNRDVSSPYLTERSKGKIAWIVIAGDRGLAGGYNSNILKLVMSQLEDDTAILPIGKKALDFFRLRKLELLTEGYAEAEEVSIGDCFTIAKNLCKRYLAGEFREIRVAYTDFVSVLSQNPAHRQLLPLIREPKTGPRQSDMLCPAPIQARFAVPPPISMCSTVFPVSSLKSVAPAPLAASALSR